jgi:hypothetical protein
MDNPRRFHGPCGGAPPHPDVLARLGPSLFKQGAKSLHGSTSSHDVFGAPTGTVPGINEGIIIPESFIQNLGAPGQLRG